MVYRAVSVALGRRGIATSAASRKRSIVTRHAIDRCLRLTRTRVTPQRCRDSVRRDGSPRTGGGSEQPQRLCLVGPTHLTLSCAAGPACRSRSGAAVAANDVRRTEARTATAVTPPRWRGCRQLGCRAEAGPHQLQREVRPRPSCAVIWQESEQLFGCPRRRYPTNATARGQRYL